MIGGGDFSTSVAILRSRAQVAGFTQKKPKTPVLGPQAVSGDSDTTKISPGPAPKPTPGSYFPEFFQI